MGRCYGCSQENCGRTQCGCSCHEERNYTRVGSHVMAGTPSPLRDEAEFKPGYHVTEIQKGVLGELSKVQEELDELKDAEAQGIKIMELHEASDLIGALVRWLEARHPGTSLADLIAMHLVTRRAFESGRRR